MPNRKQKNRKSRRFFVRERDNAGAFEIWDREFHPQHTPKGHTIPTSIADAWSKMYANKIRDALNLVENLQYYE